MKLTYNDKRRIYGQSDIYQAARGTEESTTVGEKINGFDALKTSVPTQAESFYSAEFRLALTERVSSLTSLTGFFQTQVYDSKDLKSNFKERVFLLSSISSVLRDSCNDSLRVIAGLADNISAIEYLNAATNSSVYSVLSYASPLVEKAGDLADTATAGIQVQTFDLGSVKLSEKINTFISISASGAFLQAVGHIEDSSTGQMISIVFDRESVSAAEEIINIILELVTVLRTVTEEAEYLKAATLEIIMLKADSQEGYPLLATSETINILLTESTEKEILRAVVEEE
jgi:hypothetical protein